MSKKKNKKSMMSLADLRNEINTPEEFEFIVDEDTGETIVFPDLFNLEAFEAEDTLNDLLQRGSAKAVLKYWLSEEDFEKLEAQKLKIRELMNLVEYAINHYEEQGGTQTSVGKGRN